MRRAARSRPHPLRAPDRGAPRLEALEDRSLLAASTLSLISAPVTGAQAPSVTAGNAPSGLEVGFGESAGSRVSDDGRFVVFVSDATNLTPGQVSVKVPFDLGSQAPADPEVYLADRATGAVTLVSHSPTSPTTASGKSVGSVAFSGDGSTVAYAGRFGDLSIWSRASGAVTEVGLPFFTVSVQDISRDGRFILYTTRLLGGLGGDYLYDRDLGTNTLITHQAGAPGLPSGGGDFFRNTGVLSADGSTVAYFSDATDLVAGASHPTPGSTHLYRWDRLSNTSTLVSHSAASPTTAANGSSGLADISDDGNVIVYLSLATDLQAGTPAGASLYRHVHATRANTRIAQVDSFPSLFVANRPALNGPGNITAFTSDAPLVPGQSGFALDEVFAHDAGTGQITLLSGVNGSSQVVAGAGASDVRISEDGRFVAFASASSSLIPGGSNPTGSKNAYLRDRASGASALVSGALGSATVAGNDSFTADLALSRQGNLVAFATTATNLNASTTVSNGGLNVWGYDRNRPDLGSSLLSRSATVNLGAGALSFVSSTDGPGLFTVFQSTATNLLPGQTDTNFGNDVFLYDQTTRATTLISHLPGSDAATPASPSSGGLISRDGNFVVFSSYADNLVAGQGSTTGFAQATGQNVFLFNRQTRAISLVSRATGSATSTADRDSAGAVIGATGRFVAFLSNATNLVPGGPSAGTFVYLFDTATGAMTRVNPDNPLRQFAGFGDSPFLTTTDPLSISDDGRFVTYGTATESARQVFLFDRLTGGTTLVSRGPGAGGDRDSTGGVVSPDGAYVAFLSRAGNLRGDLTGDTFGLTDVYLYEVASGALTLVTHAPGSPLARTGAGFESGGALALSDDGRFVAYSALGSSVVPGFQAGGALGGFDVILFDRLTGANQLVSHRAGDPLAGGAGSSMNPVIDKDGSLVSYQSTATDLVFLQSGPASVTNVFLWNRELDRNFLASGQGGSGSVGGNSSSFRPVLSKNSFPAFSSNATDLLAGGTSGSTNAFMNQVIIARVTLGPITIPDGATPGTVVGTFFLRVLQGPVGQVRQVGISFVSGGADNSAFSVRALPVSTGTEVGTLAVEVTLNAALKGTYSIMVGLDLGFTDILINPFTLTVGSPGGAGGGGGGGTPTPPRATTPGLFSPSGAAFYLRGNSSSGGRDAGQFPYGLVDWKPVVGDWDGDGLWGAGVVDPSGQNPLSGGRDGVFFLGNALGGQDIAPFAFGDASWMPIAGDWDGNGTVTVGVFDPRTATFYLKNANSSGAPDFTPFTFGLPGWLPLAGDWDGDGRWGVGVFDPSTATFYLKNAPGSGTPDVGPFVYGLRDWKPVAGDWDGDGVWTVGVVDPSGQNPLSGGRDGVWFLGNSFGAQDVPAFAYGDASWRPLAGRWVRTPGEARSAEVAGELTGLGDVARALIDLDRRRGQG